MNETTIITISLADYEMLLMCRNKLNILAAYVERKDSNYLDSDFIALILGVQTKGVK